jgi:hypothetical protein
MEHALCCSCTLIDICLLRRTSKKAKAKANVQRMELVKKRQVDEETNAETWMPSIKRRKMKVWRDYIDYDIYVFKALDDNFNSPKMQLMSHWVEQIHS